MPAMDANGEYDAEWLPRQCPACSQMAIVGHGRRRRQAHDGWHDWILLRRGMCKICGGTLTVLPAWCVPGARYSLLARHSALAQLAQGVSAEQATPHCRAANFRMRVIGPERQQWEKLLYTARFLRSQGRGASPFQRALPESKHASRERDLLVLRCFATTNVEGAAGAAAICSTSAKVPPLDVFRFPLSFLPPNKRVRGCLLHP